MTDFWTNVKKLREDVAVPKSPEQEGSPRLMTISEIAVEHRVSRSSVHTYRRGGTFPRPVPVEGTTKLLFRDDEVAAWFEANPKQQGKRTDLTPEPSQGEPVTTTTDPRRDLYAFAMQGKEHSPAISDRASEKIDAFRAAMLRDFLWRLEQSSGHDVAAKLVEDNPGLDELLRATEPTP